MNHPSTKTFTASLWIHANNGKPIAYEVFSVSGHGISLEIVDDMRTHADDVEWLAGLPVECVVQVLIEVLPDDDLYNYRALSWVVEEPNQTSEIDKFIESIDLPF